MLRVDETQPRRPAIALEVKTLFNAVQPLRGFVCHDCRLLRDGTELRIEVHLRGDGRCAPRCPDCGKHAPTYDPQPQRRWGFIHLWGLTVELVYAPRRVRCPCTQEGCGVKVEAMPWSEGKHPASKALMVYLAQWARHLSWKQVARSFGVSWEMVYRSVGWIVLWGLAHRQLEGVEAIGVDELHCWRRKLSGNFITLIYQIDAGCRRLLWVGRTRTERCLKEGLSSLGSEVLKGIRFVCSDMWRPYLNVIAKRLPHALNVLDRFHIVAHLNTAVDDVRRGEVSALRQSAQTAQGQRLKRMRHTLLKKGSRVRGRARARLNALLRSKLGTARAWMLKEGFMHFFDYRSVTCALAFLDAWVTRALRSRLGPMRKVARMLRGHRELLGNYFRAKRQFNSGVVEGLNLKCNLVKRRAYGLRTFKALEIALYHNLGQLPEPYFAHRFR